LKENQARNQITAGYWRWRFGAGVGRGQYGGISRGFNGYGGIVGGINNHGAGSDGKFASEVASSVGKLAF
jgi:hypothetical protein